MDEERSDTTTSRVIRLVAGDGARSADVEIDLDAGGRVRQVGVGDDADRVELLAIHPGPEVDWSSAWGSFPMAPWAGRIRNGRFSFLDDDVRLEANHGDASGPGGGPIHPPVEIPPGPIGEQDRRRHSIHGTTFFRPWSVASVATSRCELHCRLDGALGWPYPGVARQTVELTTSTVTFTLEVRPDPGSVFPASIGWHPWFVKPDHLEWTPLAMYAQDSIGLPTGDLVVPPDGPWDDCFVVVDPVTLRYDRPLAPAVTITSDCDHLVVYDRPHHATCVEPQSGPPDAPTLRPRIVTSGHPLRHTMRWSW